MEAHDRSLSFFNEEALNKAVIRSQMIDHLPISQIGSECIEFNIISQDFIDLSRSELYLKCKVVMNDNDAIKSCSVAKYEAEGDVAVCNKLFSTLFNKVDFSLQQQNVSSDIPKYCFPYKAYLDKLLSTSCEEDPSVLFVKDESKGIDACSNYKAVTGNDDSLVGNEGLKKRAKFITTSNIFEMCGPMDIDFWKQDKLLLHNINIGLKLWSSSPEFYLMAGEKDKNFNVKILEAKLRLCHVTLDSGVVVAVSEALQLKPAQYPFVSSKCRAFNIPKGAQSATFTNMFTTNVAPQEIIVCLVKSNAFNGSWHHNPFNFINGSLSEIGYYVNNTSVPYRPLQLKFGTKAYDSHYIEAWQRLKKANPEMIISFEDFYKGYGVYLFDLSNGEQHGLVSMGQNGTSKLELRFSEALDDTVVAFVYGKFKSLVTIDSARNIILE